MSTNLVRRTNRTVRFESDSDDESGRPATPAPDYAATVRRLERELAEIAGTRAGAPATIPAGHPPDGVDVEKWRQNRRITTETIDELIKKLDWTCIGGNVVRGAGNVAEITGSVLTIIGNIMSLTGNAGGAGLELLGKAVNSTGGVATTTSNLAEPYITEHYLSQVRRVVEKDQELSRPLFRWLETSRNLYEDLSDIFGPNMQPAQLQRAASYCLELSRLYFNGRNLAQSVLIIQDRMAARPFGVDLETMTSCVSRFALQLHKNRDLHQSMERISQYLSVSALALEFCQKGANATNYFLSTNFLRSPDLGPNAVRGISCCLEAVNLLANLLSLRAVAKSLMEGKSEYSDKLQELSKLLKEELKALESY